MLKRIGQAVAEGKMTKDEADWLIVGLEKGYLDGPGFWFGPSMSFSGPHDGAGSAPQWPTPPQG